MKDNLKPGVSTRFSYRVPAEKTVPHLYPEADEFREMPTVFATGFMVGFLEWSCIKAIKPHLDWPEEQSVGTHIDVSHEAATPPGLEVTAKVELLEVDGRRLVFAVEAHDGVDRIAKGRHERFVINKNKFDKRVAAKCHGDFMRISLELTDPGIEISDTPSTRKARKRIVLKVGNLCASVKKHPIVYRTDACRHNGDTHKSVQRNARAIKGKFCRGNCE